MSEVIEMDGISGAGFPEKFEDGRVGGEWGASEGWFWPGKGFIYLFYLGAFVVKRTVYNNGVAPHAAALSPLFLFFFAGVARLGYGM